MNKNQAGKGDKPRPTNKTNFDQNFDKIIWSVTEDKKEGTTKRGKTTYKY